MPTIGGGAGGLAAIKFRKAYTVNFNDATTATTRYFPIGGGDCEWGTVGAAATDGTVMTEAGTLKNFRLAVPTRGGNLITEDITVKLYLNGADSGIAFATIAGETAAPIALTAAGTLAVVAGDLLSWQIVQAVGATTNAVYIACDLEVDYP